MTTFELLALVGAMLIAFAVVATLALCRAASHEPQFGRCRYCGMIIRRDGLCQKCRERRDRDERAAMRIYEAASQKPEPDGGENDGSRSASRRGRFGI